MSSAKEKARKVLESRWHRLLGDSNITRILDKLEEAGVFHECDCTVAYMAGVEKGKDALHRVREAARPAGKEA